MAWEYFEKSNNLDRLIQAKTWVIQSIKLNSNYNNNDTYASVLFKLGELKKALKQANKAILIAKENNLDFESTKELLDKIKKKKSDNTKN